MAACLLTAAGCSKVAQQDESRDPLARLAFPSSSLPKDVSLAPWTGSDKLPWMTSNPFRSNDKQLLAMLEETPPFEKDSLREIYLAAYWLVGPSESPVEMNLTALRFRDPTTAARAARIMQPTEVEPHTGPSVIHSGSVVCVLSHTSAVDKGVWTAMVRLVEDAVTHAP
jgi:hypothetical protein